MESDKLLQEFAPVSTQEWEDAIRADLNGADYTKKLIWHAAEGLAVKPYYREEDLAELRLNARAPGELQDLHAPRATGDWHIREEIDSEDLEQANLGAQNTVAAGAEEIAFLDVIVRNSSDLQILLSNLPAVHVHFENAGEPLIELLLEPPGQSATWSTGWCPLANPDFAAKVLRAAPPALVPFTIPGEDLEESGATAREEIGLTLAAGIEFLKEMHARNLEVNCAASAVEFSFSVGSSFFFQLAKFRAFRSLWARVVESFGGDPQIAKARIYARTSRWDKTIYDPHVNILRATTEAMAAILGGADSICVAQFDECYKSSDEASRRLARNTQMILKREALLARVADPGAGSYCIEYFTDFLAREGWKLMQAIEAVGGYRKACSDGLISTILRERLAAREKAVISRRRVFTGTNQFANPAERALDQIEPLRAWDGRRGAHDYERLRLRTERHAALTGKLPRVLLAEFGDVKMRAARSNFASNFFACAGFEIVTQQFESANELAKADADLIVLCSSDPQYMSMAPELAQELKAAGREIPIVVAGNPEPIDGLRAAGIADFVHLRSNPIEVLTGWQRRLGIKA